MLEARARQESRVVLVHTDRAALPPPLDDKVTDDPCSTKETPSRTLDSDGTKPIAGGVRSPIWSNHGSPGSASWYRGRQASSVQRPRPKRPFLACGGRSHPGRRQARCRFPPSARPRPPACSRGGRVCCSLDTPVPLAPGRGCDRAGSHPAERPTGNVQPSFPSLICTAGRRPSPPEP